MKTTARIALVLGLAFAAGSPSFALPAGQRVLRRDYALLPYMEPDALYKLTLVRKLSGAMLLVDQTDGTSPRTTPLGLTMPGSSTWGYYTSSADRHVYVSLSQEGAIHVLDLGDLAVPGPLAPVVLDSIEVGPGFDPSSTRLGIIAILIGLQAAPAPAVFYVEDGKTVVLGFDGTGFRPVGFLPEEGIFFLL